MRGTNVGGETARRSRPGRAGRELARTLGAFPAFAGCQQSDLDALAGAGRVISLPARWTFLHEGTPADACYVVLDGEVRVLRHGTDRGTLGPGAVLGEMGLLGHSLRRASAVTVTRMSALRVEYGALAAVLRSHQRLAECLGTVYAQHEDADGRAVRDAVAANST